ncbi:unnamed protein product [Mucor hiemalis]
MGNKISRVASGGGDEGAVAARPKFNPPVEDTGIPNPRERFNDDDLLINNKSSQKLESQSEASPHGGVVKNQPEIASEAMKAACEYLAGQVLELINKPEETLIASHIAEIISEKLNEQLEKPGSRIKAKSMKGSCGIGAASASIEWTVNETAEKVKEAANQATSGNPVNRSTFGSGNVAPTNAEVSRATTGDTSNQASNNQVAANQAATDLASAIQAAKNQSNTIQTATNPTTPNQTTPNQTTPNQTTPNQTTTIQANQANSKFKTICQDRMHCSAYRYNTRIDIKFGPPKPAPSSNTNASPAQISPVNSSACSLYNSSFKDNNMVLTMLLAMMFYYYFFNMRR